ncbi:branched-chain amino acid ABC transporter permease [Ornithinimicrobium sp. F0845]|uniref:branched-chain amino acid ABC transporter permease n=1 Tax=Ornithinimicrobium sp. F0845 TaxID=2926412 RepID=UPI001FF59C6B|nr:branched-chain amino acid ABC transporter permease [Ornithinimicrobium sp. F0845]MCK0114228.1 branched-chain amino acid ABC transporter permease [Ornithinimicrobium sp. F0845]
MQQWIQALITGLLLGGLYATLSLGFSLTWGLLRTINFAHFGFALLASYVTYELSTVHGFDPLLTLVATVPIGVALSLGLQWFVSKVKLDMFGTLVATFGLLLVLEAAISRYWLQDLRRIPTENNPWLSNVLSVGPYTMPVVQILGLVAAVALCGFSWWLLQRSRAGYAIRASVENPTMARAFGIDATRLGYLIAAISGVSVAIAGSMIGILYALSPASALIWVPVTLAVVLLGGLANPVGVAISATALALAESFTRQFADPSLAQLVALGILVIVLLFKPSGLFRPTVEVSER